MEGHFLEKAVQVVIAVFFIDSGDIEKKVDLCI